MIRGLRASKYLTDVLFKADCRHIEKHDHRDAKPKKSREEDHCSLCDQTKIVHREPQDMRVHYGLIASGNQAINDAFVRDKINTRLGGKVLCFTTEAVGLMDNFPCLVIQGIWNYVDSHRNKAWQIPAATNAAAFAKELLSLLPATEVEQMPSLRGKLSSIF